MRLVVISDTHNLHEHLPPLPPGDVLIHCGDWTLQGLDTETVPFLGWFNRQTYGRKVLICGNHERDLGQLAEPARREFIRRYCPSAIYLEDSGVRIGGHFFWGSPATPTIGSGSFLLDRGSQIQAVRDLIPAQTRVLVTHGPPRGILDHLPRAGSVGCADLADAVKRIPGPLLHVFGHIHEHGGRVTCAAPDRIYGNAAVLDGGYALKNLPLTFDIAS